MSGKTIRKAAERSAGYVIEPSISRADADAAYGAAIPDPAWHQIRLAFAHFGRGIAGLSASGMTNKKDDPLSWAANQESAVICLDRAQKSIDAAKSLNKRKFLLEALENYSLQTCGSSYSGDHLERLDDAMDLLNELAGIVERAIPLDVEVKTEAQLRYELTALIRESLLSCGCDASISDGRILDQLPEGIADADLTGFERLIAAMSISTADSPASVRRWISRALGQGRR